jgi:hypothetical protein
MRANPNWAIRRRYIFAAFTIGTSMIIASVFAILTDRLGYGDLITGGVALISLILTSYIFGAAGEDRSKTINEENQDG